MTYNICGEQDRLRFSCTETMTPEENKPGNLKKINPEDYENFEEQFIKKGGGGGGGTESSKKGKRTIRALKNQGKQSGMDERKKNISHKLIKVLNEIQTRDLFIPKEYIAWVERHLKESYRYNPKEVEINFARSGGPGGQNVNRRETKVTLVHKLTLIRVSCEQTRSQGKNRQLAEEWLQQRLQDHLDDWRTYKETGEKIDLELIRELYSL